MTGNPRWSLATVAGHAATSLIRSALTGLGVAIARCHRLVRGFEPWGIVFTGIGVFLTGLGVAIALVTIMVELEDRQAERIFRAWQVMLTEPAGSSQREAAEYLNREFDGFMCRSWVNSLSIRLTGNSRRGCLIPKKERELLAGIRAASANLTGVNLPNAFLPVANLTGAILLGADLTGADLTDADLPGANLTDANLTRADLTRADLTDANLTGANLTGADLTDAFLTGADLTRANLTRAGLTQAQLVVCLLNKLTLDVRGVSTVRAGIAVRRPVRPHASNRKVISGTHH